MFRRAALFLLLLFTASVFPFPQRQVLRRLAPQLRDPVHGETNAKRFAKGLPPLPPARRWNIEASGTESKSAATFTHARSTKMYGVTIMLFGLQLLKGHRAATQASGTMLKFK
ncbi:uncharacterized protein EI90DRAFT_2525187 [Cantharellus anzutake]|uniref:uncharacterized protein n=1 Tax=Cantharellus anzutake TaxID=1750568 RepID=UPI0019080FA7|nr:uncharacterized protein EI90DRAFT_2525187 [Cantharellus anzutake]KAF8337965.1 hypothetical protein EI90DRAFT_2525187 [Cantharellus anzutake]